MIINSLYLLIELIPNLSYYNGWRENCQGTKNINYQYHNQAVKQERYTG